MIIDNDLKLMIKNVIIRYRDLKKGVGHSKVIKNSTPPHSSINQTHQNLSKTNQKFIKN